MMPKDQLYENKYTVVIEFEETGINSQSSAH